MNNILINDLIYIVLGSVAIFWFINRRMQYDRRSPVREVFHRGLIFILILFVLFILSGLFFFALCSTTYTFCEDAILWLALVARPLFLIP